MQTATVDITNASSEQSIAVAFSSPEVANDPPFAQGKLVSPNSTIKMAASHGSGTLNLFVWNTTPPNNIIWKGIVPTKVQKPLVVIPERKEVKYMDIVLPSGFNPVTNVDHPGFMISSPPRSTSKWWIIVTVILILCLIFYLWYKKK